MKKALLGTITLVMSLSLMPAQINPSMSIPYPLPNYDGTYDNLGANHLFYPNGGEIRFANKEQTSAEALVKFYTMNTYPKKYLLSNNNLSYLHFKKTGTGTVPDSCQRIDLQWQGSNSNAVLARVDTQNFAKLNYFTQWFGSGGRTNVSGGAAVVCQSIYPNIDLVYTSNSAGIVIYFVVYPGGSYNSIRLKIDGSTLNTITNNKLKIASTWDASSLERPQMYQYALSGTLVTPVNVGTADWQAAGSSLYKITSTSSYNGSLPLIIQIKQATPSAIHTPGLTWSTYFGGNMQDRLNKTHVDASDNMFAGGHSFSSAITFPQGQGVSLAPNNNGDGTLAKFDNAGVLQWTTFVGGSAVDEFHDFAITGNTVYCVGKTGSLDLPTAVKPGATNDNTFGGGYFDGFLCQLNISPAQTYVQQSWLTYYGGNGYDELNACNFDAAGKLFVVGSSSSTNLSPASGGLGSYVQNFNAAQLSVNALSTDGIIARFNTSSLQDWFTFYGTDALGANAYAYAGDILYDLAINGNDLYVCGRAGGTNLPNAQNTKTNPGTDYGGILAHFFTSGVLMTASSRFTNGNACNYDVAIFGNEVYTVGQAFGPMTTVNSGSLYFDGTASGPGDGSLIVHDAWLANVLHNTYLGGSDLDAASSLLFTTNGLLLIGGCTMSSDFPTTNLTSMYYDPTGVIPISWMFPNPDNFVTCLQPGNTNVIWSTHLGSPVGEGSAYLSGVDSYFEMLNTALSSDSQNALYLAGHTMSTAGFPLDEWTGYPVYFQSTGAAHEATITRFVVGPLNAIVGIEDFENTRVVIGIVPNPTSHYLTITHTDLAGSTLRYAIYDLSGKKLSAGNFTPGEVKKVDVSALAEGVYIINVSNGTITYHCKFVKSDR